MSHAYNCTFVQYSGKDFEQLLTQFIIRLTDVYFKHPHLYEHKVAIRNKDHVQTGSINKIIYRILSSAPPYFIAFYSIR